MSSILTNSSIFLLLICKGMTTAFRVMARFLGASASFKWNPKDRDNVPKLAYELVSSDSVTVTGDFTHMVPDLLEKALQKELMWRVYDQYEVISEDIAAGKYDEQPTEKYEEMQDLARRHREASYDFKAHAKVVCVKKGKSLTVSVSPSVKDFMKKFKLPQL